jgi:hypothetical protein
VEPRRSRDLGRDLTRLAAVLAAAALLVAPNIATDAGADADASEDAPSDPSCPCPDGQERVLGKCETYAPMWIRGSSVRGRRPRGVAVASLFLLWAAVPSVAEAQSRGTLTVRGVGLAIRAPL